MDNKPILDLEQQNTSSRVHTPGTGLKFIYTGYQKCGTKTIAQAFRLLNYSVCDVEEFMVLHAKKWTKFFSHKTTTVEKKNLLREMYQNFDVAVEGPNIIFWKEILEVFPDCKVVHWHRHEDEWYKSFRKQVIEVKNEIMPLPSWLSWIVIYGFVPTLRNVGHAYKYLGPLYCGDRRSWLSPWTDEIDTVNEIVVKRQYRLHYTDVLSNCPPDKLLILKSVNCGWDTLCNFTGDKVPNLEWPHVNKSGQNEIADNIGSVRLVLSNRPCGILTASVRKDLRWSVGCFLLGIFVLVMAIMIGMKYGDKISLIKF